MKRSRFIREREDYGSLNYIRMADLTIHNYEGLYCIFKRWKIWKQLFRKNFFKREIYRNQKGKRGGQG